MSIVEVTKDTDSQLALLGRAWGATKGEVVARLLEQFLADPTGQEAERTSTVEPIHALYEGIRVQATYDRSTRSVEIVDGRLAGRRYKSPSGAASAVVADLNPTVQPNRNGWGFWIVDATGELLQTIR